jgi:hypothetical protein
MAKTALRLALLFLLIGLVASRGGLVLHQLAGHFGVARLFGCRLGELRLFLFGGGWVSYDCAAIAPAQELAIDLGGIALELVLGALLLAVARRARGFGGFAAASLGLLYVLHGAFYLVTGVHDGVGDGRALHRLLGASRVGLVAAGSAAIVACCFAFARDFAGRVAPSVAALAPGARLAAVAAAILAATAAHGALMLVEQRLGADATYAATFTPERQLAIDAELRRFAAARHPTPEELAAERRRLDAARPEPFPLRPVLGAAMGLAALAGLAQVLPFDTDSRRDAILGTRALAVAAGACALAVAAVALLDRVY